MDVVYRSGAATAMARRLADRPFDQWRYRELLPVAADALLPAVVVGGTPICRSERMARRLGVAEVVLKDEGRNASGSLKDRASAVGVVMAATAGSRTIACASTGNAASSTACLAAALGLEAVIFVPRRVPAPKLAQLGVFGARVLRVDGSYDEAWELCAEAAAARGWYNRNCAVNPYLVEGKKTAGLELAEQLGEAMTDWVAVSVGDGCTVAGIGKGLEEARKAGLIDKRPKLLAVQPAGAQPLVRAFHRGDVPEVSDPATVADSLCVGTPRNPDKALQAVRRSGGTFVAVADDRILDSQQQLARIAGIFGEPAAAAAIAGVAQAVGEGVIGETDSVAIMVTGNGLKDPLSAAERVAGPIDVAADLNAVMAAVQ